MTSAVTILLVDEEPLLRRATALLLTDRGGKVSAVATIGEAITLPRQSVFDVAVIDVAPGGPSPAEVFQQLVAFGLAARRVVVCACSPLKGPPESIAAAQRLSVLRKPYPFERLVTAVFGARRTFARSSALAPSRVGRIMRPLRARRGAVAGRAPLLSALTAEALQGSRRASRSRRGRA